MRMRGCLGRLSGATVLVLACLGVAIGEPSAAAEEMPAAAPAVSKRKPRPTGVDFSVLGGAAVRLGDAPLLNLDQRVGGALGLGLGYLFDPIALGLSYEHTSFGVESTGVGMFGVARVSRALDTVWASMRVRLTGAEPVVPFLGVAMGASFQTASASGVFLPPAGVVTGQVFSCSAADSMNLGLRALVGAEVPLSPAISFFGEASFDAYRLSSEVLESCVPGAGAANAFGLRLGLVYRLDLSEAREPSAEPTPTDQVR